MKEIRERETRKGEGRFGDPDRPKLGEGQAATGLSTLNWRWVNAQ